MATVASERLRRNCDEVMKRWEQRACKEISAAHRQESLALRDSLPEYLTELVDALGKVANQAASGSESERQKTQRIARIHGRDRAGTVDYTIDQLIFEYHILRQVVCEVLEEDVPLGPAEREAIVCSIEQAVNDAATEFKEALQARREQFFNAMAHDLRSPLMTAKVGARLILQRPEDAHACVQAARRIMASTSELESMIDGLLHAGRLKPGQQEPLTLGKCALDVIVRQVAEEYNFTYGERFVVDGPNDVVGYWDTDALRRVLENLATNAVKHGEPGTPITLTVRQSGELVFFSIHNFGPPIPPERLSTVFEPFSGGQPLKSGAGWGLGLSVVERIVEAHRGRVHVTSGERSGTTFLVELPVDSRQ